MFVAILVRKRQFPLIGGGRGYFSWVHLDDAASATVLAWSSRRRVLNTLTLDVLGGRIQAIRSVINPDKLGHVGPVADAWLVTREANQARRPHFDRKS